MKAGGAQIYFQVSEEAVVARLRATTDGLKTVIAAVARDLEEEVRADAGQASKRLGEPWTIKGSGPTLRHVMAPRWWAHFLAHGTRGHGPRKAAKLVFKIDGDWVVTDFVTGIGADPFDVRAVEHTGSRVAEILAGVIG